MPRRKTGEEMNFTYVECLLYTFHHLAHKVAGFHLPCFENELLYIYTVQNLLNLMCRFQMPQTVYVVTK